MLNHYLPAFDESEHHSIYVDAPPERAYQAILHAPLAASNRVRLLLRLRELPARIAGRRCSSPADTTLLDLIGNGFFLVDERPEREIVLGKIGRFWRPLGDDDAESDDLREPLAPGTAAAIWNFRVSGYAHGSIVHTETRIKCADEKARKSFRLYWRIIAPFSAFIRRQMLQSIKYEAEELA